MALTSKGLNLFGQDQRFEVSDQKMIIFEQSNCPAAVHRVKL